MATEGTGRERFASQQKRVTTRPIPKPPRLVLPERLTKAFPEVLPMIEAYNDEWEKFFKAQEIGLL
jgi:hypothetical protein